MVSIVMITYKHQNYIKDAVLSILNQKCNFEYELIIADDNSPDLTSEIIKEIKYANPKSSCIKYVKHSANKGMMGNFLWALNSARFKYIAICEGDDYWTDNTKLQKQVDFMEQNFNFSMCFHKVSITFANENDYYKYPIPTKDALQLADVIKKHYIPTCSLLFRNNYFPDGFPSWFLKSISGDIPLEILLASKGKVKYIDKEMACYRRNEGGISLSTSQNVKIRTQYLYMYYKLIFEIGFFRSYELLKKIFILILSLGKTRLKQIAGK